MTATEATVRERAILFSGEMVRAILDGRKTQTRRASAMRGADRVYWHIGETHAWKGKPPQHYEGWVAEVEKLHGLLLPLTCPFGVVGDRLWVRERHVYVGGGDLSFLGGPDRVGVLYSVDEEICWLPGRGEDLLGEIVCNVDRRDAWKHRPSIHMPRWASRLTLEVTGIRVERVQEISEADAVAEGVCADPSRCSAYYRERRLHTRKYRRLWNSLNAKRGYGWDVNPWVWVVEFRKVAP